MDAGILIKLAAGQPVPIEDIDAELFETCDRVHATCTDECPVFRLNGTQPDTKGSGCDCFKNGAAMRRFIHATVNRPIGTALPL
jgi:hypothetical protein